MNLGITLLTSRRPHYLRQTLDALRECHGLSGWEVTVVMDRPDTETWGLVHATGWPAVELDLRNATDEPYARVSRATLHALALGFATADFVVHLEEDVVPAPDLLEYMAAQAEQFRDDRRVFTVSGWWGSEPDAPEPPLYTTGMEPWFVPWAWGTWADRFAEMRQSWDFRYWDRHLNERVRGDRLTVHPYVSRARDIGADGGVNPRAEWQERQERTRPRFAADAPAGVWA